MSRPVDKVRVEAVAANGRPGGSLDRFTSLQITNDLSAPSEAAFELGEDGSYAELADFIRLGTQYRVFVNGMLRLTGRVESNDIPLDAGAGSVVRFMVRTKLSDAQYSSARQGIRVTDTSLQAFILALYSDLGYTLADFEFRASGARDLLTGKPSGNSGGDSPVALERIKIDEARVRPPETVFGAADRHLRRHGLMHWDGPDGKIVIGTPNDAQEPRYTFNAYRDPGRSDANNVMGITKVNDVSGMPTVIGVFGAGGKRDYTRARVAGFALNDQMAEYGFDRFLLMPAESIRSQALADRAAARELSNRSKGFDTYVIENDGLSFWDGQTITNYGTDTVAEINSDVAGGSQGAYYVHRVSHTRSADDGDKTNLVTLKRGLWRL